MIKKGEGFNFEKIGAYIAILGIVCMFWSFWKDIHLQMADLRERTKELEVINRFVIHDNPP